MGAAGMNYSYWDVMVPVLLQEMVYSPKQIVETIVSAEVSARTSWKFATWTAEQPARGFQMQMQPARGFERNRTNV